METDIHTLHRVLSSGLFLFLSKVRVSKGSKNSTFWSKVKNLKFCPWPRKSLETPTHCLCLSFVGFIQSNGCKWITKQKMNDSFFVKHTLDKIKIRSNLISFSPKKLPIATITVWQICSIVLIMFCRYSCGISVQMFSRTSQRSAVLVWAVFQSSSAQLLPHQLYVVQIWRLSWSSQHKEYSRHYFPLQTILTPAGGMLGVIVPHVVHMLIEDVLHMVQIAHSPAVKEKIITFPLPCFIYVVRQGSVIFCWVLHSSVILIGAMCSVSLETVVYTF